MNRSKVLQIVAPRVVDCAQEKRIERFVEFLPERDSWLALVSTHGTKCSYNVPLVGLLGYLWIMGRLGTTMPESC